MTHALATLIFLLVAAVPAQARDSPRVSRTAVLKTTLSVLNLVDPTEDARRNAAHGDLRLVGIVSVSCNPLGREGVLLQPLAKKFGLRCLEGTSDALESEEFEALFQEAHSYGIKYNQAIAEIIAEQGL